MRASYVQGRVIGAMRGIEGHAYFCSPFCVLKPAASPPWTCCSSCACLRGARNCLAILHQGCWDKAPRDISVLHMPPTLLPPAKHCQSASHLSSFIFSYNAQDMDTWVREGALDCPPRISSGSQWRNWGWGRGKAHDPETGSRQGGDQHLESWRMFGEENAAVGPRAAS